MAAVSEEFKEYIQNELNTYDGLYEPQYASILERITKKTARINLLHPNPKDEFCMPEIGPNYEIVGNYVREIDFAQNTSTPIFKEPIIVEKITTGGYLILNGHHRWLAAKRMKVKKVPIQIVNSISESEIIHKITSTKNEVLVSFDVDEVLFTDKNSPLADKKIRWPYSLYFDNALRAKAPVFINGLKSLGFDVWGYTASMHSEDYFNDLFKYFGTSIDGVITGLFKKESRKALQKHFKNNYKLSFHVDLKSITCVKIATREYITVELTENPQEWAADAIKKIQELYENEKNNC